MTHPGNHIRARGEAAEPAGRKNPGGRRSAAGKAGVLGRAVGESRGGPGGAGGEGGENGGNRGLLTILAGIDLTRRDSAGFTRSWFTTRFGMGISTGMVAAIIAFLIGLLLIKPACAGCSDSAARWPKRRRKSRAPCSAQVDAARGRLIAFGSVASIFMVIAVIAMAAARYL